jgi:hypothetical protein
VDRLPYTRCPACGVVGPPAWLTQNDHGDDQLHPPLSVGCVACGREHTVTNLAEVHLEVDATAWHDLCRTAVPCPAVAQLVRCRVADGPGLYRGCGAVFPGPAAGASPGPPPEPPEPPRPMVRPPDPWRQLGKVDWPTRP